MKIHTWKAIGLIIAVCMGQGACSNGNDSEIKNERSIVVDELNGAASVLSVETGESDVFMGGQLMSGDVVTVASGSDLTLKIDEDKHLFADSDTVFSIEATGKTGSTETKISLMGGCILIGIDKKLGNGETFEVATSNATMAVRGTVFKVEILPTDDGNTTRLEVIEGTVEVSTVEDGSNRTESVSEGNSAVYSSIAPGTDQSITEDSQEDLTTTSGIAIDEYLTDIDREGITVSGQVYEFDEYYKDDPKYLKARDEHRVWGNPGYILVLSSPVTYNGQTINICICGFDEVVHEDISDRVLSAGEAQFFGAFEPDPYKIMDSTDITEEVMGAPVYLFDVIDCK